MKVLRIFILVGGCFLVLNLQAQRKTYLGVKGGYNYATADFFNSLNGWNFNNGFVGGYQAGIVAMNFFRDHVGTQVELSYAQKGWKQKFGPGRQDFEAHLDYIELPILVNVHTGKKQSHFFATLGCFVEYLISVNQFGFPSTETIGEWDFIAYDESRDNKFGYGGKGGVGYFYEFKFGTIMLSSEFSYSLSNIIDYGRLNTEMPNTSNKIVTNATIAYFFTLKGKGKDQE